jgi:hypothetical protein
MPTILERSISQGRSRRGDQPRPQTHQLSLARNPGLQEDVFEVGFRRRPGDSDRCGGLDQRAPGEQAGEHLGFGWRQTKGGSQGIGTILRVRWRTDEYGGNGRGFQPCAEIGPGQRQHVSEDRRRIGLGEADREPGFAYAGLVSSRQGEGGAQLGRGRWSCRLQDALRALNWAALVKHVFGHAVGMKDGAVFVGQYDGNDIPTIIVIITFFGLLGQMADMRAFEPVVFC